MPSIERVVIDLESDDELIKDSAPLAINDDEPQITSSSVKEKEKEAIVETEIECTTKVPISPVPPSDAVAPKGPKQSTLQSFFLKKSPGTRKNNNNAIHKLKPTPLIRKRTPKKPAISEEIKNIVLISSAPSVFKAPNNCADNPEKSPIKTTVILPEVVCTTSRRKKRAITFDRIPMTSQQILSTTPKIENKVMKDSLQTCSVAAQSSKLTSIEELNDTKPVSDEVTVKNSVETKQKNEKVRKNISVDQQRKSKATTEEKVLDDSASVDGCKSQPKIASLFTKKTSIEASTTVAEPEKDDYDCNDLDHISDSGTAEKNSRSVDLPEDSIKTLTKVHIVRPNSKVENTPKKQPTVEQRQENVILDANKVSTTEARTPTDTIKQAIRVKETKDVSSSQPKIANIFTKQSPTKTKKRVKLAAKHIVSCEVENKAGHINELQPRKKKKLPSSALNHEKEFVLADETVADVIRSEPAKDNVICDVVTKREHINELQPRKKKKKLPPTSLNNEEERGSLKKTVLNVPQSEAAKENISCDVVNNGNDKHVNQLQPQKKKLLSSGLNSEKECVPVEKAVSDIPQIEDANELSTSDGNALPDHQSSSDEMPLWYLTNHFVKHETLRQKYDEKIKILEQSKLKEEQDVDHSQIPLSVSFGNENIFPDNLVPELASLLQGNSLPLSQLVKFVAWKSQSLSDFTRETLLEKIKLIAQRKAYLGVSPSADRFENDEKKSMWRWEVISETFLSNASDVKKIRTARRKISSQYRAIQKLLQAMNSADNSSTSPVIEKLLAKVSEEEEKVLKYDRVEEKERLMKEEKRRKEQLRLEEKAAKDEEKRRAKEVKDEEKRKKDDEREKKRLEDEKKKEEERLAKEDNARKQKARMLSFFKPSVSKLSSDTDKNLSPVPKQKNERCAKSIHKNDQQSSEKSELFWNQLNKGIKVDHVPTFSSLSAQARASRKRRTPTVHVRVFVTAISDNVFEQKPYDEERVIQVKNKFKFLSFYEDHRPPYRGTWSKSCNEKVNGRNPFGQNDNHIDYEVDSEAEWEEGDDEQGEDCDDDGPDEEEKFDDEEGDTRVYNYQDGWLANDDELGYEDNNDDDDEARAMRRQKINITKSANDLNPNRVCIVSPKMGGIPHYNVEKGCLEICEEATEGTNDEELKNILMAHETVLVNPEILLSLHPNAPDEDKSTNKDTEQTENTSATSTKMSHEKLKCFARFVHNNTLQSKEKIVEELRMKHEDLTSSRAQATRKLDSIATKKRIPGGVIWKVKDEILESLDLKELIDPVEPTPEIPSPPKQKSDETKKKKKITPSKKKRKTPTPVTPTEDNFSKETRKLESKKRKASQVSSASINLLASFLKKKKA